MIKRPARLLALLLVFLLCLPVFSGCSPFDYLSALRDFPNLGSDADKMFSVDPGSGENAVEDAQDAGRRTVPFGEMQYERPDIDEEADRLAEIRDLAGNTNDLEALEPLLIEANEIVSRFSTMYRLAMIHSSMDKTDPYWLEEERLLTQAGSRLDTPYQEIFRVLYESPLREQIEAEWSPDFFSEMEQDDFNTRQTQSLFERESALISEYSEKLATLTIDYQGETLTYGDVMGISDYDAYIEAYSLWLEKNNPILAGIYIDLVEVRRQMAEALGYDDYTDLAFSMSNLDYTPEMARGLLSDIERYLVPVYRELLEYGTHYYPEVALDYEDFVAFVRNVFSDLEPSLLDTFDAMLAFGLYDFEERPFKDDGAFTTYLPDYDAPFIIATYDGTFSGMGAVLHEFGHFNDSYVTWDSFFETADTSEIFSQALVLLVSNYFYDYFDPETAYMMQYDCLSDMLATMLYQPYYTALEFEAYSLPDESLTVENLNRIAAEQAARFDMDSPELGDADGMEWVATPHLYESPFYTFAYATSGDVALQIWEMSLSDPYAALDAYYALLIREESDQFIENVEAAGLQSPFTPGQIERLSLLFERYLIDEDWSLPVAA